MQKVIKHKFSFIVSIVLMALPILGGFVFSFSQTIWDKLAIIFPMFILTYADSFPLSILGAVFLTFPIYILGIIGIIIYILTQSRKTFFLKGMLFLYLLFFILITIIPLTALIFQSIYDIDLKGALTLIAIIFWSVVIYKAAIKFDDKDLANTKNFNHI
jgi:hypothetical protein